MPHTAATIALSMLAAATIIGGCKQQTAHITQVTPKPGSHLVSIANNSVEVVFDTAMQAESVQTAFRVSPAEGLGDPIFSWTTDRRKLTVTYSKPFRPNTAYTIVIGKEAKSISGAVLSVPHKSSFVTSGGQSREILSARQLE